MNSQSLVLLVRRHDHSLWLRPLCIAVAGLSLELLIARAGASPQLQLGALVVTVVCALAARLWPRRSLHETARALDAQIGARNRLEAVAELRTRNDPLAEALRSEADAYLAAHPLPRATTWYGLVALFIILLGTNLTLLGPNWARAVGASVAELTADNEAAAKPESPADKPAPVMAATVLRWITPAEEIAARPQEEVPLAAEAESPAGLRSVMLHVARNGEALPPVSVVDAVAAGIQPVSSALRLEEMKLQPFDVVTYFLRAERIRPGNTASDPSSRPVSSPLQFIQIKSSRDEPLAEVFSDCAGGCVLEVIRRLKREELAVLRDSVALAHNPVPSGDTEPAEGVTAVAARQTAIQEETATLLPTLVDAGVPAEAIDALTQAEQEAGRAAVELGHARPDAAIDPAGRALARFAAAEKALAKSLLVNRRRATTQADASDLPPRESTPAGRLEKLAGQQGTVADQLASRSPAEGILSEQDRLARDITKLAAERALPVEINDSITAASDAAREAARQLHEQDAVAAAEPATRAAQALRDAVTTMLTMANTRATDELLAAQRALIRTATDLQLAPSAEMATPAQAAGQSVGMIQQDTRAAARHQQQQGSTDAARRLEALSKAITQSGVQKDLANLARSGAAGADPQVQQQRNAVVRKLTDLAQRAADSTAGFSDLAKTQARAIDELRRAQLALDRATQRAAEGAITSAGLDASVVIDNYEQALMNVQRLAGVESENRGVPPPPGPGAGRNELRDYAAVLSQRISGLLRLVTSTPGETNRAQRLTTANPSEAPPAYRNAVADYFETLARDGATRTRPNR